MVHWRREWQTTPVFLPLEPHEQHEKAKRYDTPRGDEPPRSESVQYTTGEEQRAITNSSRKNEAVGTKQERHPVVDVSGGESKIQCCKEQYCVGPWNVRSMNQGKLDMIKQEMARLNINIIGISELSEVVAQSRPTLCNPVDCSPPGSSVHGILQARILEWVAVSFSRGSSQPRDRTQVSCIAGRCFNL